MAIPPAPDATSHWVWHRDRALDGAEVDGLAAAGVGRLFWHWADLDYQVGSGWRFLDGTRDLGSVIRSAGGIDVVPVVRLTAKAENMADPGTFGRAAEMLAARLAPLGAKALQVDYDCPDRLLGTYAGFLRAVRDALDPVELTATALAAWPRQPEFADLEDAVDGLFPMFYDLEPDAPDEFLRRTLRSPADWESTAPWVRLWRSCTIPWHAGLANFSRVTVFEADGTVRGHLRSWKWEHLVYHPDFEPEPVRIDGVLVLRPRRRCVVGTIEVAADQALVFRRPTLRSLRQLERLAEECGAAGTAWFRLPDAGDTHAAWSVTTLAALEGEGDPSAPGGSSDGIGPGPRLDLRWHEGTVVLANTGPIDLPAFGILEAGGPDPDDAIPTRHRSLQIRGPLGFCEEILPGAFNTAGRIGGTARDDPAIRPGTFELRFADLPSGASLTSGAVRLGPTARSGAIEWRIDAMPWRPLAPPDSD